MTQRVHLKSNERSNRLGLIVSAFVVGLGVTALSGCHHTPSGAELFDAGKTAAAHGDQPAAIADYNAAILHDTKDARVYFDRAQAYRIEKKTDLEAADFTTALELVQHGDSTLTPKFVNDAHFYRGVIRVGKEQWQAAKADLLIATQDRPNDWVSWDNLGYARFRLGDYQGAIPDFIRGLHFLPKDPNDHYNLAYSLYETGQYTKSIPHFTAALEGKPDWGIVYQVRGRAYYLTRNYKPAESDFTQAIHRIPKAWSWDYRCEARESLGNVKGALSDCNHAISDYPNWTEAYLDRGWAKAQLGAMGGALTDMNTAIKLDPKNPATYKWRGWVRERMSQYRAAFADYGQAVHLNPRYSDAVQSRVALGNWITRAQQAGVTAFGISAINVATEENPQPVSQSEYQQHVSACGGYYSEMDSYYEDCLNKGVDQAKNDELTDKNAAEEAEAENYDAQARVQQDIEQQTAQQENEQARESEQAQYNNSESSGSESSGSEEQSGESNSSGYEGGSSESTESEPAPEAPEPVAPEPESGGE